MKKKKARRKRLGGYRIPTARGTVWHKDKSKYNRRKKHREDANE
jgi:hypothetical protein